MTASLANNFSRKLTKLPNYQRRFGVFRGGRLWMQIESGSTYKSEKLKVYRVPGLGKVYLRDSASDRAIFWQCLVEEQYDTSAFPHHRRWLEQYQSQLKRGQRPVILDLGGNIGLAAIWFAKRFPEAQILVVEPDEGNLEVLTRNVAGKEQIQVFHGAVWNAPGWLRIVNPEAGFAAFRVAPAQGDRAKVRAYTVEELLAVAGCPSPWLVKIDIEGAQAALFASNTAWVEKSGLIVIELDDWLFPWQGTSRPFFSCISRYPFEYLLKGENLFCFRDFEA
nr:methyltransferase, FkbM family [uncultured Gammaproteobacteria bacterium]